MTASIFLQVLSTGMEPQNVLRFIVTVFSKPIGVSEYKITSSLPDDLEKQLPSVEDIQKKYFLCRQKVQQSGLECY